MGVVGIAAALIGAPWAFNVFGVADRYAALIRQLPEWMRGPGADSPSVHRSIGWVMVVLGISEMIVSAALGRFWH